MPPPTANSPRPTLSFILAPSAPRIRSTVDFTIHGTPSSTTVSRRSDSNSNDTATKSIHSERFIIGSVIGSCAVIGIMVIVLLIYRLRSRRDIRADVEPEAEQKPRAGPIRDPTPPLAVQTSPMNQFSRKNNTMAQKTLAVAAVASFDPKCANFHVQHARAAKAATPDRSPAEIVSPRGTDITKQAEPETLSHSNFISRDGQALPEAAPIIEQEAQLLEQDGRNKSALSDGRCRSSKPRILLRTARSTIDASPTIVDNALTPSEVHEKNDEGCGRVHAHTSLGSRRSRSLNKHSHRTNFQRSPNGESLRTLFDRHGRESYGTVQEIGEAKSMSIVQSSLAEVIDIGRAVSNDRAVYIQSSTYRDGHAEKKKVINADGDLGMERLDSHMNEG